MAVEAEGLPRFGRCDAPPRFGLEEAPGSPGGPDSPASDELMGLGAGGVKRLEALEEEEEQGSPGSPLHSGSPAPDPSALVLPPPLPSLEAPTRTHAPGHRQLEPVAEGGGLGGNAAAAGPPPAPPEPSVAAARARDSLRQRLAETSGKVDRVLLETTEMHARVQAQEERFGALRSETAAAQERAVLDEHLEQISESIGDLQAQHEDHCRSLSAARARRSARRRASAAGTASDVWARHMQSIEQQMNGLAHQVEAATTATVGGASGSSAGAGVTERPEAREGGGGGGEFATREELRQLGEALSQLRGQVAQAAAGAVGAAAAGADGAAAGASGGAWVTQEQLREATGPLRAELADVRESLARELAQLTGRPPVPRDRELAAFGEGDGEQELRREMEELKARTQALQGLTDDLRQENKRAVGELSAKVAQLEPSVVPTQELPRAAAPSSSSDSACVRELEAWSARAGADLEDARRSLEGVWEDIGAIKTRQDLLITTAGSEREALLALQGLVHDVRRECSQACDELRTQVAAQGAAAAEASPAAEAASDAESGGEELAPAPREPFFQRRSVTQCALAKHAEAPCANDSDNANVELAAAPHEPPAHRRSLSAAPVLPALLPRAGTADAGEEGDALAAAPQEPLAHRRSLCASGPPAGFDITPSAEEAEEVSETGEKGRPLRRAVRLAESPSDVRRAVRFSEPVCDVESGLEEWEAEEKEELEAPPRRPCEPPAAAAEPEEELELLAAPPAEPRASRQSLCLPSGEEEACRASFSGGLFMDPDGIVDDEPEAELAGNPDPLEGMREELRELRLGQEGFQQEAEADREVVKQLVQHLQQEFTQALDDLRHQVLQLEPPQEPEEVEDLRARMRDDVERLIGQMDERVRQELADSSASMARDVAALAGQASRSENGLHAAQQNLEALRTELQALEQRSSAPPEELRQELRQELRSLAARADAQEAVGARREELAGLREGFKQELERLSAASARLERGLAEAAEGRGDVDRLWENFNLMKARLEMLDHGACNEKEAVQVLKQHLTDVRRESALMADELRAQVLEICSRPAEDPLAERPGGRGVASLSADLGSLEGVSHEEVAQIAAPMSEAVRQELGEAANTLARQMAALAEHMQQSVAGLTQGLDALHGDVSALRTQGDALAGGLEEVERRVGRVEEAAASKGKVGAADPRVDLELERLREEIKGVSLAVADPRVDLELERLSEELQVLRERGDRLVEVQARASRELAERFKHLRAEVQETQVALLLQDSKDSAQRLEELDGRADALAAELAGMRMAAGDPSELSRRLRELADRSDRLGGEVADVRTDVDRLRDDGFAAKTAQGLACQELALVRDELSKLPQLISRQELADALGRLREQLAETLERRPGDAGEAKKKGLEDADDEEVEAAEELFLEFFRRHSLPLSLRLSTLQQQISELSEQAASRLAQPAERCAAEDGPAQREECRELRRDLSQLAERLASLHSAHARIAKQLPDGRGSLQVQDAGLEEARVPTLSFARLSCRVERLEAELAGALGEAPSSGEDEEREGSADSEPEAQEGRGPLVEF